MATRLAALGQLRWIDLRDVVEWLRSASTRLRRQAWRGGDPARSLRLLPAHEKALLRRFVLEDTTRLHVSSLPGAAIGLELADLVSISREPAPAPTGALFVLCISPETLERLRRDPEALDEHL
jgi:hypothetical protein